MITITCGIGIHAIYAHDPLLIYDPVNVTDSAICAVRDYMVDEIKKGENSVGYRFPRCDGKVVKLVCIVEDDDGTNAV